MPIIAMFAAKYARYLIAALGLAALLFVGVKSCTHRTDVLKETATQAGAVTERAESNAKVIDNAAKIAKADAATRANPGGVPNDPHCRDCAND